MKRFASQIIALCVFIGGALNGIAQTDDNKLRVFRPSVDSTVDTSTNDVIVTTGTSDATSMFLVRNSSLSPLFTVRSDGKIGVGTTAPTVALSVDTGAVRAEQNMITSHTSGPIIRFRQNAGYAAGRTIGAINFLSDTGWAFGQIAVGYSNDPSAQAGTMVFNSNTIERMRIDQVGNVGIGTNAPTAKLHVAGDILASGSITGATVLGAVYQDVAEWVPATSDMTPGTVVVLNPAKSNEVMPATMEYDDRVAGVVSAQPGVLLGVGGAAKEMVATTGRVKVKVDATREPIQVGDLLVSSSKSGVAMKSVPVEINGRRFHQPGTIIGKALEPLPTGEGEILVLLSLQ